MKKRTILIVCLLLTICVIVASLFLPEMIIKGTDSQTLEKVNSADKSYSLNTIEAYSGDLDLYRKLLLLKGIWKSEYTSKIVAHTNESGYGLLRIPEYQTYWDIMENIGLVSDADFSYEESLEATYSEKTTVDESISNKDFYMSDFIWLDQTLHNIFFDLLYVQQRSEKYYYYFPLREEALLTNSKLTLIEKRSYMDTALQKYSFDILVCTFKFESDLEELSGDGNILTKLYWDLEENRCLGLTIESTYDNLGLEDDWKVWLESKSDNKEFIDYDTMQNTLYEYDYKNVEMINDLTVSQLGILDMNGDSLSDIDKENFVYKCYDNNEAECVYFVLSYTQNTTEIYFTIAASEP